MVKTRTITVLCVAVAGLALDAAGSGSPTKGHGIEPSGAGWTVVLLSGAPDPSPAGASSPDSGPVYR